MDISKMENGKDGKLWNLTIADKNGIIIRKWDNGVEHKETP